MGKGKGKASPTAPTPPDAPQVDTPQADVPQVEPATGERIDDWRELAPFHVTVRAYCDGCATVELIRWPRFGGALIRLPVYCMKCWGKMRVPTFPLMADQMVGGSGEA